jgi:predicted ArsR family transcriptional regulator
MAPPEGVRPAGRPSKHYHANPVEQALSLPFRHDDVLASLLVRALDALGPGPAERLADEVGYDYGRMLADRMGAGDGHRTARAAVGVVADALTAHGFAAHAESNGDTLSIVSECCPFGDTAQQYPHVICALDRGIIRGMLAGLYGETSPHFEASRPDGDDHCVARV